MSSKDLTRFYDIPAMDALMPERHAFPSIEFTGDTAREVVEAYLSWYKENKVVYVVWHLITRDNKGHKLRASYFLFMKDLLRRITIHGKSDKELKKGRSHEMESRGLRESDIIAEAMVYRPTKDEYDQVTSLFVLREKGERKE